MPSKTLAPSMDYLLLTPGPTPVPEFIREKLGQPLLHHRTPEFGRILEGIFEDLRYTFQTKNGEIFILTGSGTAAMEAAIVNFFSYGDKVIVYSIGAFGERWGAMAKAWGLEVEFLREEPGYPADPTRLKKCLERSPRTAGVFVTHVDTSTATVNPIQEIGDILAGHDSLFLVDSVSGLAGEPMKQDEWGIDVCVSASQKGLMCPPGAAFLSASVKAMKKMQNAKMPRYYLDLRLYEQSRENSEMPFTPPISLLVALAEALTYIRQETLGVRWQRYEELAQWAQGYIVDRLGCQILSRAPSRVLTAGCIPLDKFPQGFTSTQALKLIRDEFRITIADGQGSLKGKIFRIAHMGAITKKDVEKGFLALQRAFKKFSV